jgi:glycosyltransferase involved in cell wall biosynthesis
VRLTVLSVAYPLAPVGPDAVGGAEQILSALDHALVAAGHRSIVVAAHGSQVAGMLVPLPAIGGAYDAGAMRLAREQCGMAVERVLQRHSVDLVHMHGLDFAEYLPPPGVPVLATLHLPLDCYPPQALWPRRPGTWLHCVSQSQHATCPASPCLLPPIENGVASDVFPPWSRKRGFALMLTRICPEKGAHLALDAAKRAGIPLVLAGQVFPYRDHQDYFAQAVQPRLDASRRYVGPARGEQKRRLLAASRCLVVASLVPETSSLAALEALAAGTPVVAFDSGALSHVIEQGRTGFLVRDEAEMAEAMRKADTLEPAACRAAARERFPLSRMIARYFDLYRMLAASARPNRTSAA